VADFTEFPWFLTSSAPADLESAFEAEQPQGWCKLPQACGSLDKPIASTTLTATQTRQETDDMT